MSTKTKKKKLSKAEKLERTRKRLAKLRKAKPCGYLLSPTSTYDSEAIIDSDAVLEHDFVYAKDEDGNRVIGRVDALTTRYEKKGDDFEVLADISWFGTLGDRNTVTLRRRPLDPETDIYAMSNAEVSDFLGLDEGMFVGTIDSTDVCIKRDRILRGHTMLVGKTGVGKSWSVGVLIEEASKLDLPVLMIDPHGEYHTLSEPWDADDKVALKELKKLGLKPQGFKIKVIMANPEETSIGDTYVRIIWEDYEDSEPMIDLFRYGVVSMTDTTRGEVELVDEEDLERYKKHLGKENATVEEYGDFRPSMEVNPENPELKIVKYKVKKASIRIEVNEILEAGYITIVDLHNLDPDESRAVVDYLLSKLFLLRKRKKVSPFVCVLEEAHIFCPSQEKVYSTDTVLTLSKEARKFGMPVWFVTQRPALINTTLRANCENWIVLKVTHPSDKTAIVNACEGLTSESLNTIKNLPVGHAFLTGTIVEFPLLVKVRHRQSHHFYDSGFAEVLEEYDKLNEARNR